MKPRALTTPPTIWNIIGGDGPVVATALHDGHRLRRDVQNTIALDDAERLREEDPYTAGWTELGDIRVVGTHSRFQVDLNRPRAHAIYRIPAHAWGLTVWQGELRQAAIERSMAEYDAFYRMVYWMLRDLEARFGGFVIYDLHTYNHRRSGPGQPRADPADNPEINLGTGTMSRQRWAPLVDRFLDDLRHVDFMGRGLDVRENEKFLGGGFPQFVHDHFPETGCVLSIEVKKFFMDEWTGEVDVRIFSAVRDALAATVPGVRAMLQQLRPAPLPRKEGA